MKHIEKRILRRKALPASMVVALSTGAVSVHAAEPVTVDNFVRAEQHGQQP
jgi:hypothetical protein